MLLSGFTTLHYIFEAERRIKPEFILYIFRIICTVLNCFFGLTVLSSYYLHCAQLLLRPHHMYLRIIFTVLNCFFGLTVCIFVLFALCSTASSASLYISSYYFHCAQLLLRPQRVPHRKTGCDLLTPYCDLLVSFLKPNDIYFEKDSIFQTLRSVCSQSPNGQGSEYSYRLGSQMRDTVVI